MSSRSSISQDTIDYRNANLTEVPPVNKPHVVKNLILAKNSLKEIPNPNMFTNLRYLNISNNIFVTLAPLSALTQLVELDCSFNSVISLDFSQNLANLKILHASHNKIGAIASLPPSLQTLDVSFNLLNSLKFIEKMSLEKLEYLSIQNNKITDIREMKYTAFLTQLHYLTIGFLESNENSRLLEFAKFICPSLQEFDNFDCSNATGDFDQYQIISLLSNGTEQELKKLLNLSVDEIKWNEPQFLDFEEKEGTGLDDADIERRLQELEKKVLRSSTEDVTKRMNDLEKRITKLQNKKKDPLNETDSLIQDNSNPRLQKIQQEVDEMKKQISKITELLYVHDKAISKLWDE